jgi:hypothetical protein
MNSDRERSIAELCEASYQAGLSIAETIKAIRDRFGLSLGESKLAVAAHPRWVRTAQAAVPMQEEAIRIVTEGDQGAGVDPAIVPPR